MNSRRTRKRGGARFYWMFALLGVGLLSWIWWNSADSGKDRSVDGPFQSIRHRTRETNQPRAPIVVVRNPSPIVSVLSSNPPIVAPEANSPSTQTVFEVQLGLARQAISPGSLDGVLGFQTRAALRAFQARERLPVTGELDDLIQTRLSSTSSHCTFWLITSNDLARLRPLSPTWLGKSRQASLDYESILELVAEKGHANPKFIRALNPDINWTKVTAGTLVKIPNAEYPQIGGKAAFVRIHLGEKTLQAFDENTNLLAHFPCSIASRVEKRLVGTLHVEKIAVNPNYRFDPEMFPESAEASRLPRALMLPAGPNNPVGTAWISLDRPGYGIHGTPRPEEVGRTESHGCFRLANWNADYLVGLVWIRMPVFVQP